MKTVELLDVTSVVAKDDFTLILTFENKTVRVFDMVPYLNKRPFQRLQNIAIFKQAQMSTVQLSGRAILTSLLKRYGTNQPQSYNLHYYSTKRVFSGDRRALQASRNCLMCCSAVPSLPGPPA